MKIAVVDDEKIWRNKAVEIIKEYFEEVSISTFASGEGLLDNNEEYAIVKSNTQYGLSVYDYIVLDSSTVEEDEIINE